jgi:hypothetical protein
MTRYTPKDIDTVRTILKDPELPPDTIWSSFTALP